MRTWQWSAVPLGIALFLCIVAFPFTHYADIDLDLEPSVAAEKGMFGGFKGWRNGFLPIREIKRLNNYEINGRPIKLTSGPNGNAQPNWLVVIVLCGLAVALCGFMFGFRPKSDPRRKNAMYGSFLAFGALGLAFLLGAINVILDFSWKGSGSAIVLAIFSAVLLWASPTSRSRQVDSKATE